MNEVMLKIDNVSKRYKLGEIGGTTLRDELQRMHAKIRGKEDPTKKIGSRDHNKGETFLALDGVSFDVRKGERVGIIGHNGAGKSTLLKLISRVTAPTGGTIGLNGRVASMLEVGTGFHGELTGRENIYMNGAILGMTKKEIDSKMEDIIEFSECRKFIDTPVKRYSSGMYVKLAFSVAAHLDSEIMIMDEVLAVGDMAFQKKCLNKMSEVSKTENRTILYVSHNMNTIRQLCDRVVVLDHGKVIFDGNVEEGINIYLDNNFGEVGVNLDLTKAIHYGKECTEDIKMLHLYLLDKVMPVYYSCESMKIKLSTEVIKPQKNIAVRMSFQTSEGNPIGAVWSNVLDFTGLGKTTLDIDFPLTMIPKGKFAVSIGLHQILKDGNFMPLDHIARAFKIEILQKADKDAIIWSADYWGPVRFPDCSMKIAEE